MDMQLTGRVAFITGGGGAIGSATGRLLAEEGVAVALLDLNEDAAKEKAAEIVANGGKAEGFSCDVTSKESVANAFEAAEAAPQDDAVFDGAFIDGEAAR